MLLGEGLVGKVLIRFGGDLVGDEVVWKGPWKGLLVTSILALIGGGRLCFGGGHFGKILKCHKEINYRCLISFWSGVHVLLVSLFGIPIIRSISNFFGRLKKNLVEQKNEKLKGQMVYQKDWLKIHGRRLNHFKTVWASKLKVR